VPYSTSGRDYAGYLFDLDGTLVDTAPDLHQALNHALTSHGHKPVSIEHTRHWIGHGASAMIAQALEAQLKVSPSEQQLDAIRDTFLPYYEAHVADHSQVYPDVVETLQRLQRRGARLAVVTNKITRFSLKLLDALALTAFFDSVVCGDTTQQPKPAADPALYACSALGLEIDKVLFVGDSTTDVGCARAAGCDVVCVRDGYNHGVEPAKLGADAVIESFKDLV
jgi:phosphoglycolate phosphatase